eukprot:UN31711
MHDSERPQDPATEFYGCPDPKYRIYSTPNCNGTYVQKPLIVGGGCSNNMTNVYIRAWCHGEYVRIETCDVSDFNPKAFDVPMPIMYSNEGGDTSDNSGGGDEDTSWIYVLVGVAALVLMTAIGCYLCQENVQIRGIT